MVTASRYRPTTEPDSARIARARLGVLGLFLSMGVLLSTYLSRYPTIRDELGVDLGRWSALLIFGAGGALVALMLTGWAAARFGTRAVLVYSTIGHTAAFIAIGVAAHAGAPVAFAAFNLLTSFSFSFSNVSMNAEAAAVERHMGRKVMPQFHAAFSVGMALGLALGWVFSHAGVSPVVHLASVAAVLAIVRLAIIPMAVIDGQPVASTATGLGGPFATARAEYRDRRIVMIGAIAFAASMTEGAAAQWIAMAGVNDFKQKESTGDAMYWVFVVAMVTVRSLGTRLLERFGRVAMLRASAISVITGILIFAFTPTPWLVPVALIFWGMGAALGVPICFSAAADEPKRAAARVAAVSSFSTIAGLAIPPLIGNLAQVTSTRHALLLVIFASLTSFTLAKAVRRDERLFARLRRRLGGRRGDPVAEAIAIAPSDTGTTLG